LLESNINKKYSTYIYKQNSVTQCRLSNVPGTYKDWMQMLNVPQIQKVRQLYF